ncbi:MAG TPA: hypothetical protein VG755_03335 [Nannocystaceae bacterium]|nr:hypothetical protein [Nannocystaceae bacterium]
MTRIVASALSLALALAPACKKDEPAPPAAASPATTPESKSDPVKPSPSEPIAKPEPPPPSKSELDPLLDLLPTGTEEFVIVRDPKALIEGVAWFLAGERDAMGRLEAAKIDGYKPDPERDRILRDFDTIAAAILGSVVQLDRGIVVYEQGGETITLIASPDATVIPALVAKVRGVTETDAVHCKPAPAQAGWVGCAAKAATVDAFVAGKAASDRRKQLLGEIAGGDLDRANVIVRVKGGSGAPATTVAVETAPGEIELHIGQPAFAALDGKLAAGPAPALGLVSPAASFAWARVSPELVAKTSKDTPAPFGGAVGTATGELLLAWIDKAGVVALAGVNDPSPVTGLFPFIGLAKEQIPKKLPDGSGLTVEVRDVDHGDGKTHPTVLAKLDPSAELRANLDAMGLAPEAVAFAAGGYAAVVLGGGEAAIPAIARYSGASASTETTGALPAGLQRALADKRVLAILHVTLDGLQSHAVRKSLGDFAKIQPTEGVDAAKVIDVALDVLAPLSSISLWLTHDGSAHAMHLAVRSFDDPASEEGKEARAAMLAVGSDTKDAATAYGELAAHWPSSPRKPSYEARAGTGASVGQAASSAFLIGIAAAIAIPAFVKYRERAAAGG